MSRYLGSAGLVLILMTLSLGAAQGKELPMLKGVKRIVFLGDSITYAGNYVDYIETWLLTHVSDHRYEIIDLGLPSETVSGLTEPGHAGGAFPRPDLAERLDRALEKAKPDLVFACYGMNDGIYYPFSEDRFAKYQAGIRHLVERVTAAHARIVLITPPPFDPVPLRGHTLPAGLDSYPSPYEGYDEVLGRYSQWLLEQRKRGWKVADIHSPINVYLVEQRKQTPDFHLAGDGVHINTLGHWLIAEQLLHFLGATATETTVTIDAKRERVTGGSASEVSASPDGLLFTLQTPTGLPIDPALGMSPAESERARAAWDRLRLIVRGAQTADFQLYEDETLLGTVGKSGLAAGVDLLSFANAPSHQRGLDLLKRVQDRQRLLKDAWLTAVGHKRPGMNKGLPLEQAQRQAMAMEPELLKLAGPVSRRFRLAPGPSTPPSAIHKLE